MKRTLAIAAAVAGLTLCAALPRTDMHAAQRKGVKTSVFVPPSIPVSVSAASVGVGDGRGLSELTVTVTNDTDGEIKGLRLAAFVARPTGHLKSGEGWRKEVAIPARSSQTFSVLLRGQAIYGDRAVVALHGAAGPAGVWETGLTEVFGAGRALVKGDGLRTGRLGGGEQNGAAFLKAGAVTQGIFCRDALKNAGETCKAGIDTFSCDEKTQSFSFSCKSPIREAN